MLLIWGPCFNVATGCVQGVSVPRPLGSQEWHGDARPLPEAAFNQENICLLPRTHCQVLVQHGKGEQSTHTHAASSVQPSIMVVYQSGIPGTWRDEDRVFLTRIGRLARCVFLPWKEEFKKEKFLLARLRCQKWVFFLKATEAKALELIIDKTQYLPVFLVLDFPMYKFWNVAWKSCLFL